MQNGVDLQGHKYWPSVLAQEDLQGCGFLLPLNQPAKKPLTLLAEQLVLTTGEIRLQLHSRGEENCLWDPFRHWYDLVLCFKPVENYNPIQAGLLMAQILQGWRCHHSNGTEPQSLEVLSDSKGNTEWVVKEGQLWTCDMTRWPATKKHCDCHKYFLLILYMDIKQTPLFSSLLHLPSM